MNEAVFFHPPVRHGLVIHLVLLAILLALGVWGLAQAAQADIGLFLLLYLIPALLALSLGPPLAYRSYALFRAVYRIERDGIRLRWGLRVEDIPIDAVLGVIPANELKEPLPQPRFYLPGALLGRKSQPDGRVVEYLAASSSNLVVISTADHLFAISPADPQAFIAAFQQYAEMGSLSPFPQQSVYPSFLLARVWNTLPARYLLIAGLILGLLLISWVSLLIPGRPQVFLGFGPTGEPRDPVPAVRLLLLPVLNGLIYFTDLLFGLFLFRNEDRRFYAYLLWGGAVVTAVLFFVAVSLILLSVI